MTVRAKFILSSVITTDYGIGNYKTLEFQAQYDDKIPEDVRFCKATPSGKLTMQVDNPVALEQFEIGKYYYLDFTKA